MIDPADQLDFRGPALPPDADPYRSPEPTEEVPAGRPMFHGQAWWVLAAWSVGSDFAMFPLVKAVDGPPHLGYCLPFAAIGCALAQGCLLAAWLAWGDGPFSRRLMWHWSLAGALCGIWLVGLGLSAPGSDEFVEVGANVALTVPLVSLGAQFPLWIVRQLFGWRLIRKVSQGYFASQAPLAIRDLMAATVIVAVAFGLARLAPEFQKEMFWIACIALAVAGGISTIAMLPAGAILLRPRQLTRALVYAGLYAAIPISILWLAVAIARWYGTVVLPPYQIFVCLSALMLSFAGTLVLAAVAVREQGYWLAWGRGQIPAGEIHPW